MSAAGGDPLMVRKCRVLLRRCDCAAGGGRLGERGPACTRTAPYTAQAADVSIKCEVGADGTPLKQELDMDSLQTVEAADVCIKCEVGADSTPLKQELDMDSLQTVEKDDISVKSEVGTDGILIKEELDIGPTLVQPRTISRSQLHTDEVAPSGRLQAPGANAGRPSPPLHYEQLHEPTSSRLISEKPVPSKCSFISDMAHGLSDKRTSTIHKSSKRDFVDICDKINKKLFKCDHCKYSTSRRGSIKKHMPIHTEEPRSSKCSSIWNMAHGRSDKRISTIHKSSKRYFVEICDKMNKKLFKCDSISRRSRIQRHMGIHTGEKPYKCKDCDYSASRNSHLKSHMRVHTGEKPHKCKLCNYSASQIYNLKRHMRIHTGEKPYKCKHCNFSSSDYTHLETHMRIHTGEKPYKCKHCNYSATQNTRLKTHMRIHTGEKPYKCKHCDFSTSDNSSLKRHMRIHTGEKPYKCKHCDYSASRNIFLKTHMRMHIGEKPYKCKHCNYSTSRDGTLKCHMRTHTGEKHNKY